MEIGVYTLGRLCPDPVTGEEISPAEQVRRLVEEVEVADQAGLDVFGIGEHHRPDYVVSSPAVVLAAASARTRRIRLSSAVSVLGADDPIRVFQDFATLDLLSGGRAEIMAGRGAFLEPFPLFGHDISDADTLFATKLDTMLEIRRAERVTWADLGVYPRPLQDRLPVWLAVGGSPESAAAAGARGLPLAIAVIGGTYERFAAAVDAYREAYAAAGHDPSAQRISINSHGFVGATSQHVDDAFFPYYASAVNPLTIERGFPPVDRRRFRTLRSPEGSVVAGSPAEVTDKILAQHDLFGHDRFLMQISVGGMPHAQVLRAIELLGSEVAPVVRREVAQAGVARDSVAEVDPLAAYV